MRDVRLSSNRFKFYEWNVLRDPYAYLNSSIAPARCRGTSIILARKSDGFRLEKVIVVIFCFCSAPIGTNGLTAIFKFLTFELGFGRFPGHISIQENWKIFKNHSFSVESFRKRYTRGLELLFTNRFRASLPSWNGCSICQHQNHRKQPFHTINEKSQNIAVFTVENPKIEGWRSHNFYFVTHRALF